MDNNTPTPSESTPSPLFDAEGQHPGRKVDAQSARRMSAAEQRQWFDQRAARGSRELQDAALAMVPDAPPEFGDSLFDRSQRGDLQAALNFLSRPGGLPPEEDDRLP